MHTHLYTTKYKPATDYKPPMVEVRHDLMTKPIAKLCWQYGMRPYDNHRYVVHCYLRDFNPHAYIVAHGECKDGYWFAVQDKQF